MLARPDKERSVAAGLAAHTEWAPTLRKLSRLGDLLCLFTDFCEEAALRAVSMAAAVAPALRLCMPVRLNPFRQPLRRQQPDSALPSYSNCFMFALTSTPADQGFVT